MADLKISKARDTDMTNQVSDFSVSTATDTGVSGIGETTYQADWTKWLGYYYKIPELASVIDKKAMFTVGKGYTADAKTTKILDRIRGWGKDTFNIILQNTTRTYTIAGDSYAEIIKDTAGRLINLKPLNPGSMKIVANKFGLIKRYEQVARGVNVQTWKPEQIFHCAWNRIADDIHGISTIEKMEDVILMRNEAMSDLKTVFHRYVKPLLTFVVDTDNEAEIEAFKKEVDKTVKNGENLVIPKDTVDKIDRTSIPQFSTLDPIPWIQYLEKFFIMAEGVPSIVLGKGDDVTEASAKISYLAFQQMVEWNQLYLERQIEAQLGLKINLSFPASIAPELISDEKKDSGREKITGQVAGKDQK